MQTEKVTEDDVLNAYISYLEVSSSYDFPGTDEDKRKETRRARLHYNKLADMLEAQQVA